MLANYRRHILGVIDYVNELAETIDFGDTPESVAKRAEVRRAAIFAALRGERYEASLYSLLIDKVPLVPMGVLLASALGLSAAVLTLAVQFDTASVVVYHLPWNRYGILCLGLALGGMIVSRRVIRRIVSNVAELSPLGYLAVSVFGLAFTIPLLVTVVSFMVNPVSGQDLLRLGYAVAVPAFIVGLLTQAVGGRLGRIVEDIARTRCVRQPLDPVIIHLLAVTAYFYKYRTFWTHGWRIRELRRYAEWAARRIGDQSLLDSRTRLMEFRLRREIRADYRKLAELIRLHGIRLARVRTREDYIDLCESLRIGLLSSVKQDWQALVEHAPEIPRYIKLGRFLRVAAAPLMLTGAAVAIGFLPGVDSQSITSVRILLVVGAILSFAPVSDQVSTTIRSTFDKALPWSKQ
ncbi:hypothetical protein [Microbispora rosea]|uniref:hypothetical protein n=1 Tax=Microbispora rosea TaxID=58117 RepID=UPI003D89B29B